MQTTKAIFLALVLIGLGFLLYAIQLVARIAVDELKSTGKTLDIAEALTSQQQELVNQLSDLLETIPQELDAPLKPEDKPVEELEEPESEQESEEPDLPPLTIPPVLGLSDDEVRDILEHCATSGDPSISRAIVKEAGYRRKDYEAMVQALRRDGYIDPYSVSGRAPRFTEKGVKELLEPVRMHM